MNCRTLVCQINLCLSIDGLHLFCIPAAAVAAGWFQQCAFLWSDWSAPPLCAELTGETEHPSVCPPTGSSYHSSERERESIKFLLIYVHCIRFQKVLAASFLLFSFSHYPIASGWSQFIPLCFDSKYKFHEKMCTFTDKLCILLCTSMYYNGTRQGCLCSITRASSSNSRVFFLALSSTILSCSRFLWVRSSWRRWRSHSNCRCRSNSRFAAWTDERRTQKGLFHSTTI